MSTPVTEDGWKTVPLAEVVLINPRPAKDELQDDALASFIPMKCVEEESGRFTPLEDKRVADVRKGYTPFRDGDVIFAKVTPCMENGKAAVMKGLTNGIGFGSTEFFTLRPKGELDSKYLLHFILQSSFRRKAARNMTGAVGLRRVPKPYLEQQTIPLPPLDEQRRIVAEIEKQFTRLDAGVAALKRAQANLKRYRAGALKAACEGRLVPTEAELARNAGRDYESAKVLLQRILEERRAKWNGRSKYFDPAPPSSADLPQLPEGWIWASVEQITENFDGRRIPLKSTDRDKRSGQYPYYGASGIIDDIDDFLFDGDFLLIAEDGANLLSRSTPIAFKATGKFWVNNHAHVVQTRDVIPLSYLEIFLNGKDLAFSVTGSAQPKLTQAALNKIPVPLPPLAEQERIVAEVERRLSVVEETEATVTANLQRAARLRQAILQKAFAGGIIHEKSGQEAL